MDNIANDISDMQVHGDGKCRVLIVNNTDKAHFYKEFLSVNQTQNFNLLSLIKTELHCFPLEIQQISK